VEVMSDAASVGADLWEDQAFTIPPRSKFYHLEPKGLGTPYVESLTGYAARLAQEHLVTSNALLKEVIPLAKTLKMMPLNFSCFHRAINGTGSTALNLINALELLTMRRDLASTTMIAWANVLPDQSLIRTKRAWCSACYECWRETGKAVYEPLIWTLEAITICPLHKIYLTSSCPRCDAPLLHFSSRARPGFCTRCKEWLGLPLDTISSNNFLGTGEDAEEQLWKAKSVGELLANAPGIAVPVREQVARSLRYCVNSFSGGRVSRFASQFEVPLKPLQGWLRGERIPILKTILQLTYKFNTPLLPFLCGRLERGDGSINKEAERKSASQHGLKIAPKSCGEVKIILVAATMDELPEPLQRFVRMTGWNRVKLQNRFPELCATILARYADHFYTRIDKAKALCVLQAALKESPPPSVVAVVQRIGCNAVSLRHHFLRIIRQLVSRYNNYWRNTDWQLVETRLKEELTEYPPHSVSEVARSLGVSPRGLRPRFPEITKAIARRFEGYVKARMEMRKELLLQEIPKIVATFNSEGIYPSVKRVAARVEASKNMREIRLTLRELKRDLASNTIS
jgi:hypothetical protein